MKKRAFVGWLATAGAVVSIPFASQAQEAWPSRPIKILTPVPPGGTSDILAREFGQRLSDRVGQPVIIENRPGANGVIATVAAARAPADGYTLLMTLTQHIQVPTQFKDVGYDPVEDFTPIGRIGAAATVLAAHPRIGVKSAVELARVAPGKQLSFGTTATGPQVIMEVFNKSANLGMLNVPYKGEAAALQDLIGGQIDMALLTVATARGYIEDGRLVPLAVIAPRRAPALPDVPTFLEQGFKEVNWTGGWYGFLAPAHLPSAIASRLVTEFKAIYDDPAVRAKLEALNMNLDWIGGDPFRQAMRRDMEIWSTLVKRSSVVIER